MNTLPSNDVCCNPCDDPVLQQIPGPAGVDGADGSDGTDGSSAFTASTQNFTMPAELATVSVFVTDTGWMILGQVLYVQGAGYFGVTAINSGTNVVLRNLEDASTNSYLTNVAPTTVINSGAKIGPAGVQGSGSVAGVVAGGDLKGTYPNPKISVANAKGSLIVGNATDGVALSAGTNGQIPAYDSTQALGLLPKSLIPITGTINALVRLSAATGSPIPLTQATTQQLVMTNDGNLQTSGGNARGANATDLQSQRAVATQVASGARSFLGGGENNTAAGTEAVAVGGDSNSSGGGRTFIGAGQTNTIGAGATESAIVGGMSNTIDANSEQCFIGGGDGNLIHDDESFIGGGFQNVAGDAAGADRAVVCGGDRNQANGLESFVGGGQQNGATGPKSAIVGGNLNTASGDTSCIGGGDTNGVSAAYSSISGGRLNVASGTAAAVNGGQANQATGPFSSVAGGISALASRYAQLAHASGSFAAAGDAQWSVLQWRVLTTGATITEAFLDNIAATAIIPVSTAWMFAMHITGRRDNGDCAVWKVEGGIKNNAGVASLIGTPTKTLLGVDAGASATWGQAANITIDATSNYLRFQVTGTAANNIRWTAVARLTELAF